MTTMTELTFLPGPLKAFTERALMSLSCDVRAELVSSNHVPLTHLSSQPRVVIKKYKNAL